MAMIESQGEVCDQRYVFRTGDLGQARDFLNAFGFTFEVARRERRGLDLCVDSEDLASTSVIYMQRGAHAELTQQEGSRACGDYWIVLPVRETMQAAVAGDSMVLGPGRGFVSSPNRRFSLKTMGRGATFNIGFTEAALRRRLAGLLGDEPPGPLEFASTIDLANGVGHGLARHVRHIMGDFVSGRSIFVDPVMARSLEDAMICQLLLAHPHTFSQRLARLDCGIAPRDMRRATEFIEAHLDLPVTIGDIAEASGIAGRTLFKHFQAVRGVSPMRYMRDRRFQKARQALLRAEVGMSVTGIAVQSGFSHLGRFAVEYRKRFGETPSETLLRRLHGRSPS